MLLYSSWHCTGECVSPCIFWVYLLYSCHTYRFQTHLHLSVRPFPLCVLSCYTCIFSGLVRIYGPCVSIWCVVWLGTCLRACWSGVRVSMCLAFSEEQVGSCWEVTSKLEYELVPYSEMLQFALYFFKYRASPLSSVVELGLISSASGSSLTIKCPCHQNYPVIIPGSD